MTPTTDQIRTARKSAKLTQREAADLIHAPLRTYQDFEYGHSRMHAGLWELFCIKIKQLTEKA